MIGLRDPTKSFPISTDVGVLKWRFQSQDEAEIPLTSKYNFLLILSTKNETIGVVLSKAVVIYAV